MTTLMTAALSSYPPRACGIATFTADLVRAIGESDHRVETRVVAIDDPAQRCVYGTPVWLTLDQHDPRSWARLARRLSASEVRVLAFQHEFGLAGRYAPDGTFIDHASGLAERLAVPLVTTLHTVVTQPHPSLRAAIRRLHAHSAALIVMAHTARRLLAHHYGVEPDGVSVIPHGVPEPETAPPEAVKAELGLEGRTVVSTFGLINRGKGLQDLVRALPEVVRRHPEVVYLVIGQTHPVVRQQEGERYRAALHELARRLHLEGHVRFVDRYLTQRELMRYLQATDIYARPTSIATRSPAARWPMRWAAARPSSPRRTCTPGRCWRRGGGCWRRARARPPWRAVCACTWRSRATTPAARGGPGSTGRR